MTIQVYNCSKLVVLSIIICSNDKYDDDFDKSICDQY